MQSVLKGQATQSINEYFLLDAPKTHIYHEKADEMVCLQSFPGFKAVVKRMRTEIVGTDPDPYMMFRRFKTIEYFLVPDKYVWKEVVDDSTTSSSTEEIDARAFGGIAVVPLSPVGGKMIRRADKIVQITEDDISNVFKKIEENELFVQ
jgi:hypothetical protein